MGLSDFGEFGLGNRNLGLSQLIRVCQLGPVSDSWHHENTIQK